MDSLNDPVKLLARRFSSLPPHVRLGVAAKLLRLRGEDEAPAESEKPKRACERRKSFLAEFWEEVEAAHGDALYSSNPFAGNESATPLVCIA